MSGDLVLVVGGLLSCFGLGWAFGRTVKAYRQFFDKIS